MGDSFFDLLPSHLPMCICIPSGVYSSVASTRVKTMRCHLAELHSCATACRHRMIDDMSEQGIPVASLCCPRYHCTSILVCVCVFECKCICGVCVCVCVSTSARPCQCVSVRLHVLLNHHAQTRGEKQGEVLEQYPNVLHKSDWRLVGVICRLFMMT